MEMAATIEDSPEFAPAGKDYNLNDPSDKELCPIDTEMGVTFHPLLVDQLRDHFPNYMEVCDTCFKLWLTYQFMFGFLKEFHVINRV